MSVNNQPDFAQLARAIRTEWSKINEPLDKKMRELSDTLKIIVGEVNDLSEKIEKQYPATSTLLYSTRRKNTIVEALQLGNLKFVDNRFESISEAINNPDSPLLTPLKNLIEKARLLNTAKTQEIVYNYNNLKNIVFSLLSTDLTINQGSHPKVLLDERIENAKKFVPQLNVSSSEDFMQWADTTLKNAYELVGQKNIGARVTQNFKKIFAPIIEPNAPPPPPF